MNEHQPDNELADLLKAISDGSLSPEQHDRLESILRDDPVARATYLRYLQVNALLEWRYAPVPDVPTDVNAEADTPAPAATAGSLMPGDRSLSVETENKPTWRRVVNIAAMILIGLSVGVPLGWAYGIPLVNQSQRESREIVFESFEDPEMELARRFPTNVNQWFGRVLSVPADDGMPAVSGMRVGQFDTWPNTKLTYAWYLIDLDEHPQPDQEHVRTVEVEASFFTSNPSVSSVFQIRLGAFSQEPVAIRPIWNDHETLFDTVLQHVGRNHITEPGDQTGWHKLRATIEIPPGTRSVVISLGAGNEDADATISNHYVDAVQVHLVDTFAPVD